MGTQAEHQMYLEDLRVLVRHDLKLLEGLTKISFLNEFADIRQLFFTVVVHHNSTI